MKKKREQLFEITLDKLGKLLDRDYDFWGDGKTKAYPSKFKKVVFCVLEKFSDEYKKISK